MALVVFDVFLADDHSLFDLVPVIPVFTKYDLLVTEVKYGNSMEFTRRTKALDPDARNTLLLKETNKRFETLCGRPFRMVAGPDVPYIAVSSKFSPMSF